MHAWKTLRAALLPSPAWPAVSTCLLTTDSLPPLVVWCMCRAADRPGRPHGRVAAIQEVHGRRRVLGLGRQAGRAPRHRVCHWSQHLLRQASLMGARGTGEWRAAAVASLCKAQPAGRGSLVYDCLRAWQCSNASPAARLLLCSGNGAHCHRAPLTRPPARLRVQGGCSHQRRPQRRQRAGHHDQDRCVLAGGQGMRMRALRLPPGAM